MTRDNRTTKKHFIDVPAIKLGMYFNQKMNTENDKHTNLPFNTEDNKFRKALVANNVLKSVLCTNVHFQDVPVLPFASKKLEASRD